MVFKLSKYQKTVALWGVICFIGFIASQFSPFLGEFNSLFFDLRFSLFYWLILTSVGLYFQAIWMWYPGISSVGSQISWIAVCLGGWVLTYFKL
jgi:hypothetical protein